MSLEISTRECGISRYVGMPATARLSEFGAPHGPNHMIPRIYQWLADHGVQPNGGPMYVYRHVGAPDEPIDLTVAVEISESVKPTDGLVLGSLPAGTYIVGRHVGSPDDLAASQARVREWARMHGHRLGVVDGTDGVPWTGQAERFLTDPAVEPDPTKWVIELLFKTA